MAIIHINKLSGKSVLLLLAALAFSLAGQDVSAQETNAPAHATNGGRIGGGRTGPIGRGFGAISSPDVDANWQLIGPAQDYIAFLGESLADAASELDSRFKRQFDVILPSDSVYTSLPINLTLRNVRAAEIFDAMNMQFQTDKTPLHWNLVMNGSRPTALLQPLIERAREVPPTQNSVFSIVDIIDVPGLPDNLQIPGAQVEQNIVSVLHEVRLTGHTPGGAQVKIHADTGLLVFSGTAEQTDLIRSTLEALKQTAAMHKMKYYQALKDEAARKPQEPLKK